MADEKDVDDEKKLELERQHEFNNKAADHSIDGVKTIIVLMVRITGVYLTIVAIFFAVLSQAKPGNELVQDFRFVVMAATSGMFVILGVLFSVAWRGVRFYFDVMEDLASPTLQARLQSGRRLSKKAGVALCAFGVVGLLGIFVVLVTTYPQ